MVVVQQLVVGVVVAMMVRLLTNMAEVYCCLFYVSTKHQLSWASRLI
jgi:hypothetical protein